MPNQQLLDYIKQQMQLGVPQDAIKNALLNSGWPAAEVEEALKPAGGAAASPAAKPAAPVSSPAAPSVPKIDSVSKASAPSSSPFSGSAAPKTNFFQAKEAVFQPTGADAAAESGGEGGIKKHLLAIILGVVIVLLLAASGYLYARNSALSKQLGTGGILPTGGDDLSQQVATLTADKTALQGQVSSFSAENSKLKNLLNLFAVPDSAAPSSTTKGLPITLTGKLAKITAGFTLTTPENLVISIRNSRTGDLAKALETVLTNASVEITGTYDIGTPSIAADKINAQTPEEILNPPAAATSTTPAAAPAPAATSTPPPAAGAATTTP